MLVRDPDRIRLAMLGMVDGNGHPYSWSAIINGRYDRQVMAQCPYPVIPQYLDAAPRAQLGIPGVTVTHVWCDDPDDARSVAKAAYIEHVVDRPEDVIGQVDAVVIPTDRGEEHVRRCRPFVEAGLPVFVDKPMVDSEADLRQFVTWQQTGRPILSSSGLRYSPEFASLRRRLGEVGELRVVTVTMCKSLERYGIHALEPAYLMAPPGGYQWVQASGDDKAVMVHVHHETGVDLLLAVVKDMVGGYGRLGAFGTKGALSAHFTNTFAAFRAQMVDFVQFLRTGQASYPFTQTIELMRILIAALRSRAEGGRRVSIQ